MANFLYTISISLTVVALIHLIQADLSTIERIKKHQEWLRQRNKPKPYSLPTTNLKSYFEPANLWRFQKGSASKQKWSINEVYPEHETTTLSTLTTSTDQTVSSTYTSNLNNNEKISETTTPISLSTTTFTTAKVLTDLTTTAEPTVATTTSTRAPLPESTNRTTAKTTSTKRPKPKIRPYPRWTEWGDWSGCSRSCGGGVMSQTRKCINRNSTTGQRYPSDVCMGLYKRYKVCNEQTCPSSLPDFRIQQCVAFNDVDFQGQRYSWEPYLKDDAECELNCKPLGMNYFATLNDSVIDGTPCSRPAEYYRSNYTDRAICVNGICKAIHASGSINGLYANSGSVSCGGLLCRPVTGIFTRDPLPEDAYVHVATIPPGASNISITELKNSANLLVLRTSDEKYIFNGENSVSDSATYEAAGATFDYHRIDGLQHGPGVSEWITSTGPIRSAVELLVYSKTLNPGIKYEYLLPIVSESEENELSLESSDGFLKAGNEEAGSVSSSRSGRRRKFNWKVVGFSSCTKSCGGGTQTPVVRCARDNPIRYYSQRRCMHSEKPVLNENLLRCNTQPCPAYWRFDDWGECKCQNGEAFRERELSCVQELASGIVIHVDNLACMEEKPPTQKQCECPKPSRRRHQRYRTHAAGNSSDNNGRRRDTSDRSNGNSIWLMSDWNQYCSAECGAGVEYRTVFCDRSAVSSERCDSRDTPETTRPCQQERHCEQGDWFAGPWSPCNGNCFNLTRSRSVLCIHNQLITDEEECKTDLKPQTYEKCSHEEVEYCAPRWHYSRWSECTKSCDGGTQRRSVKCLEYDEKQNALRDSTNCRYAQREPIFRSCNKQACDEMKNEMIQNDAAPSEICTDKFPNCNWAVQAKLCSYDYYSENCCQSCRKGA